MKLSTAIRIGSMTTKQIRYRWDDGVNGRCALGAACDAVGYRTTHLMSGSYYLDKHIIELFPILSEIIDNHILLYSSIGIIIPYLNDVLLWPREKIADWVENIENELEQQERQKLKDKELCAASSH